MNHNYHLVVLDVYLFKYLFLVHLPSTNTSPIVSPTKTHHKHVEPEVVVLTPVKSPILSPRSEELYKEALDTEKTFEEKRQLLAEIRKKLQESMREESKVIHERIKERELEVEELQLAKSRALARGNPLTKKVKSH